MNKEIANKKILKLRETIRHHDKKYFVENAPQPSDQKYDRIFKELKELEEKFPSLITPYSPTQRVSERPLEGFKHVKHSVPMLSMDNTYSHDELREFDKRVRKNLGKESYEYAVEFKIDGVSVSLRYDNGNFKVGATRGNGRIGDDVSFNLRTIKSIPLKLSIDKGKIPKLLEVRGEVFMTKGLFEKLNKEREKNNEVPFANPRNASAGSLKLLDSRITAKRHLDIFVWGIGEHEGVEIKNHSEALAYLTKIGMKIIPHSIKCKDIEEVIDYCQK